MTKTKKTKRTAPSPAAIQIGEFIEIPALETFGCVINIKDATSGADDARVVLLQEHPDQPVRDIRWVHLEQGQFNFT